MSQQSRYWMALALLARSKIAQREGLTMRVMHTHELSSEQHARHFAARPSLGTVRGSVESFEQLHATGSP